MLKKAGKDEGWKVKGVWKGHKKVSKQEQQAGTRPTRAFFRLYLMYEYFVVSSFFLSMLQTLSRHSPLLLPARVHNHTPGIIHKTEPFTIQGIKLYVPAIDECKKIDATIMNPRRQSIDKPLLAVVLYQQSNLFLFLSFFPFFLICCFFHFFKYF